MSNIVPRCNATRDPRPWLMNNPANFPEALMSAAVAALSSRTPSETVFHLGRLLIPYVPPGVQRNTEEENARSQ